MGSSGEENVKGRGVANWGGDLAYISQPAAAQWTRHLPILCCVPLVTRRASSWSHVYAVLISSQVIEYIVQEPGSAPRHAFLISSLARRLRRVATCSTFRSEPLVIEFAALCAQSILKSRQFGSDQYASLWSLGGIGWRIRNILMVTVTRWRYVVEA